jgi:hypothetical protein
MATVAWFAFYQFPYYWNYRTDWPQRSAADKTSETNHHAGDILIPLGVDRACRHITFDNITGGFQEGGVAKCVDDAPGTNSTQGRMNAIRDAFSRK